MNRAMWPRSQTRNGKYNAKKTMVYGIAFDSQKEARFYLALLDLKRMGTISKIELQPSFTLQPDFVRAGHKIKKIVYKADFKVTEPNGHEYYIDTKGMKTKEYLIKKKMLLYRFPDIDFREE